MSLVKDAARVFWFLTDWEFRVGIIGIADWVEREQVFEWLLDNEATQNADPRGAVGREREERRLPQESPPEEESTQEPSGPAQGHNEEENPPLQFIPAGLPHRWLFTKDDPDFYPSVPHGHLNNKTNSWPKLNPYTGRAFSSKDVEDSTYRLQKRDMIELWNDAKFRRHALETITWYRERFPYYRFPVRNPLKLPRWKRR